MTTFKKIRYYRVFDQLFLKQEDAELLSEEHNERIYPCFVVLPSQDEPPTETTAYDHQVHYHEAAADQMIRDEEEVANEQ